MPKRYTFSFQNGLVTIDPKDDAEDERILADLLAQKNPIYADSPEGDVYINPLALNFFLRGDVPVVPEESPTEDPT